LQDIKSIEALRTRDLSLRVRLFELYGEKLNLLIEKENEYSIMYVNSGKKKQLNYVLKMEKKTLSQLEGIAKKIEKQTRDPKILTKINYYRALNYSLIKEDKMFYRYIKRAEKYNRDKKMAKLINTKLADYHFNEKQYKQAVYYYRKIIGDHKNGWVTKHYYNLAWSELKLNQFKIALKHLKIAHYFEQKKGYFKIGDQMIDAILLFHAYAQKTDEGLDYIKSKNLVSFDNLMKYLHYVFENGDKRSSFRVINEIEKLKLDINQEYLLLSKKVLVYRTLKRFSLLQRELARFKKKHRRLQGKLKDESKKELVTSVKSYTGYLQELVVSRNLISEKRKRGYIKFISYNFNVLKYIDRSNELEYSYYEGETYFSVENYRRASFVYALGIKKAQAKRSKNLKFLDKSFDSLFKALEKIRNPNKKVLLFTFSSYLYFYPKGDKSNLIYQRLIKHYQAAEQEGKMFSVLQKYNKNYPEDQKVQRNFYKQILNKYIDKKNIGALVTLKKYVDKRFLGFTQVESKKIAKIITELHFSKYDSLAKQGKYDEALQGFEKLYKDKKSKYSLRVDSLRKKMFYENKLFRFGALSKSLKEALVFFNKTYKKTHKDEINFYTENICVGDFQAECLELISQLERHKHIAPNTNLKSIRFKLYAAQGKNFRELYKISSSQNEKNYLFKLLLMKDPAFKSGYYSVFYRDNAKKIIIDSEVEKRVLNTFYKTLSFESALGQLEGIALTHLKQRLINNIQVQQNLYNSIAIKLPATPSAPETTEEMFARLGEEVLNRSGEITTMVNNIIAKADPNFLPYHLSKIIRQLESEVKRFKKFIPISKNPDLERAMTNEVTNFHKYFDGQIIEYRNLYYQSVNKTQYGSGAKLYSDDIMINAKKFGLGGMVLWQE
jgi:hypothetical protein